ncbi:hypothetical protein CNYM01_04438 [Colletotrichum nymphaeae SA-01]|uniref:Uncharacterized protein n=1 Tax=Colletotrichum nymphaeae SA-01 TaxID=1460502 RepID=A0A135S688_9PEZI|nr:hypothetical protein CNYM01_04438 [Colletotrichum nymphaeae SA-01]
MQFSGFSGALGAMSLLFSIAEAGCAEVGSGDGNNPLRCTSYSIPRDIGTSVTVGLQTLSIGRTDPTQKTYEKEFFFYDMKNEVNYQVNFAVQFWNPTTNKNAWKTYSLAAGEKCNISFQSTLQNVKLTC